MREGVNVCTVSDWGYLVRVLLLYDSLVQHEPEFHLWLLAMDERVERALTGADREDLTVIPLREVEDKELTEARQGRNWIEWVWLFQPAFPLWLLERKSVSHVLWLDGDMWLFGSLRPMFDEIGEADVAVSPHRFADPRQEQTISVYNGGATYFRNSERGRACCQQWRMDCVEWDYWWSKPKPGHKRGQKGGTQGYLDDWPTRWGAHVVGHLGCNLAPWNQGRGDYRYRVTDGRVYVNDQPLIFYHFQDFKPERGRLAGPAIAPFVEEFIYWPYLQAYILKKRLWQPGVEARDVRLAA